MGRFLVMATAALGLAAGAAQAQSVADQVVAGLQAQGFDRIEVAEGRRDVRVEAIRGATRVVFVYDLRTGELLSQETGRVGDDDDDIAPGVSYGRDDDGRSGFGRSDDEDDDDDDGDDDDGRAGAPASGGDDDDDDRGGDDDDDDDDRPGLGSSPDDDDDDRGGDDDDGDDDDDDRDDD